MSREYDSQRCHVVFPSAKTDLFYMNMRVYRVQPAERLGMVPEVGSRLIWCAVYHADQRVG